jgi:ribosomal protein S12 methylthiotransferase
MPKICIITLGCPKNTVEGEKIAGMLDNCGWTLSTDLSRCDAALVHTCSFIKDAKLESAGVIKKLSALRKRGELQRVVVSGCLAQESGRRLFSEFPQVDAVVGTGCLEQLPSVLAGRSDFECGKAGGLLESAYPRLLSSGLPSAYLRIAEGCGHKCSFCVIPTLRGRYTSRRIENIVSECVSLASAGIKEAVLIAQDTTLYGNDIYGKPSLPALLNRVSKVRGIEWLRILYAYPDTVSGALLETISRNDKVCKYLDIPLQHASGTVLDRMRRKGGVRKLLERIKTSVPGISLRTTFIVGFPGETEAEFKELKALVAEGWFEHAGVFEYSPVENCAQKPIGLAVPERVKKERKKELMLAQKKVVARRGRGHVGKIYKVLIEYYNAGKKLYTGRTYFQAPEIDGITYIKGKCRIGQIQGVKITGYSGYDLIGKTV